MRRSTLPFFPVLALLAVPAPASEALLAGLEQRVRREGVERVNVYLSGRPHDMRALHQGAADCNVQAIDLAARLSRGTDLAATKLHNESLRIAAGGCAEYVLSRITLSEVPKICSSVSSWTVTQTARELRRRIQEIEADDTLRSSERGKACGAAYLYELQNTRVGVRAHPPGAKSK